MSQETVELVRRWLDGLAHGELSLELCDPEMVIENVAEFPITGPTRDTREFDAGGGTSRKRSARCESKSTS